MPSVLLIGPRERAERRIEPPLNCRALAPEVSVIVPVKPNSPAPQALLALKQLSYPGGQVEVLVARGLAPAMQRNEAVRSCRGEFLLFLDDDSRAAKDLLQRYLEAFRYDPTLGAVGGPAEPVGDAFRQKILKLLLSEPWVMGRSAARYCPPGEGTPER